MTRRLTALVLIALLAALTVLAGCGGGDDKRTIPRDEGRQLIRALKKARTAASDRDCDDLRGAVRAAQREVRQLPGSVEGDTRRSLSNGVDNLESDAEDLCARTETTDTTETEPPPTTETTETEPPPTLETTETEPPPTETTETEPPPTEPPPTEPPPTETDLPGQPPVPPGAGNGNGNGKDKKDKGNKGKGK